MKETPKKLFTAYVGESQARNRYTFWSKIAKKEGYVFVSKIFLETADQEQQHGSWFYKMLQQFKKEEPFDDMKVLPDAEFHTTLGTTVENLKEAAAGENYETTSMYPEFAKVADEEGFKEIAGIFRNIAVAEARHRDRYLALEKNIRDGKVFKREKSVRWICRNCGYVHEGSEAPNTCPACAHPQSYYEVLAENY